MLENIVVSLKSIWSHKLRSLLTMLGIIIGIASIITIVSTIRGTNEQIKENIVGSGNNVVNVRLTKGGTEYEFDYESNPEGVPVIDENKKSELLDIKGVEGVSLYRYRSYAQGIFYKNNAYNNLFFGSK